MKKYLILSILSLYLTGCVGQKNTGKTDNKAQTQQTNKAAAPTTSTPPATTRDLPNISQPLKTSVNVGDGRVNTPKQLPKPTKVVPSARARAVEPLKVRCGNDFVVARYYEAPIVAARGVANDDEKFYQDFLRDENKMEVLTQNTYYIPVVFHILTNEGGQEVVSLVQCQSALDKVNEDFNALNADFSSVNPAFSEVTGKVNIKFILAQKDPKGNATNGIVYYEKRSGYGMPSAEEEIATIAWDNTKYMNIYVLEDLYGDGVSNNSGVSWYPDQEMTKKNVARIVFNHLYLGDTGSSIADGEFQSVFTHECGHWLNLRHTFSEGSCEDMDRVADTPPADVAAAGCGAKTSRCGNLINYENYMDYNAECYKMFTHDQVYRMVAALHHVARKSLWQNGNLVATGILETTELGNKEAIIKYQYTKKKFSADADSLEIISEASGRVVATPPNPKDVNMATLPKGVYTMKMKKGNNIVKVRVGV